MREILEELLRQADAGEDGALVTVIGVRGSAYRREGARMVCRADGGFVGAVSGGCLEGDVVERSLRVARSGRPELAAYDSETVDDVTWGLGLGCGGSVEVLIEPTRAFRTPAGRALLAAVRARFLAGRPFAWVTPLPGDAPGDVGGGHLLVAPEDVLGSLGSAERDRCAVSAAREALAGGAPPRRAVLAPGGEPVFVDVVPVATRLVIVGAGYDAVPLARMAREVGLRVDVFDHRPAFAKPERFPEADRVFCDDPARLAQCVGLDDAPAVVVMTHNLTQDTAALRSLLTAAGAPCYLGLLGPALRTRKLLEGLAADGVDVAGSPAGPVRTPIGLDIGSTTPAEIALAALAEILAVVHGRTPVPLSQRVAEER